MDSTERVSLHQLDLLGGHRAHLVLTDEGVPAHQGRRGDDTAPAGAGRVLGRTPQWVVVSVGDGDVAEGVGVGPQVVRRLRVWLGYPHPGPQPGDALVGDGPRIGHIAYYR